MVEAAAVAAVTEDAELVAVFGPVGGNGGVSKTPDIAAQATKTLPDFDPEAAVARMRRLRGGDGPSSWTKPVEAAARGPSRDWVIGREIAAFQEAYKNATEEETVNYWPEFARTGGKLTPEEIEGALMRIRRGGK